jgi:carbonic anhydrase
VILNVAKLKTAAPIIDKAVAEKKVRIVGGVYNLDDGRVELLS